MTYETARLLQAQSYEHWASGELFSYQWFILAGMLAVFYAAWLVLLDRRRVRDLLLLGLLCAVAMGLIDIVMVSYYGFWEYRVALTPFKPPPFTVAFTLVPIVFMLVLQYTSSWQGYIRWGVIGAGLLVFGVKLVYLRLGILQLHHGWTLAYSFLLYLSVGMGARACLQWLTAIEHRAAATGGGQACPALRQAVAKPLPDSKDDERPGND